jgi:hypothetical protein
MLTDDQISGMFWKLIDEAHGSSSELEKILLAQPQSILRLFHQNLDVAYAILWDSGAAQELREQLHASDDVMDDIFGYVIGRGQDYYGEILDYPERIPNDAPATASLRGIAAHAFRKRFGQDIDEPDSDNDPQ